MKVIFGSRAVLVHVHMCMVVRMPACTAFVSVCLICMEIQRFRFCRDLPLEKIIF